MMDQAPDGNVAVYWDFENIHASLSTLRYGPTWYRQNRFSKQPRLVDIPSVMEFIAGLGRVNVNRAYANWTFFLSYNAELQDHAIDLVQLFPRGAHGKNGADIRMAIDVIEDMALYPHIATVVIVGGDSDYIPIAQRVRQKGKTIVGIGVKEMTNQYWIKACNVFRFYSGLLARTSMTAGDTGLEKVMVEQQEDMDFDDAKDLLRKALTQIAAQTGEEGVRKAAIKPMMTRLDPSFDEGDFGYKTFAEFLNACDDIISITGGVYDHIVALRGTASGAVQPYTTDEPHPYERILKKQQIRLIPPDKLKAAASATFTVFSDGSLDSFDLYRTKVREALRNCGCEISDTDISKAKAIFYKALCFSFEGDPPRVRLAPDIESEVELYHRAIMLLVGRILDNIDGEPDIPVLAEMLLGTGEHTCEAENLVREYREAELARAANSHPGSLA